MTASVDFVTNDTVTLTNTFTVSGVATDPTTISLAVTNPAGTTTTYTFAGGTITKVGTGIYSKSITADSVGLWRYVWTGTGTAADVEDGSFTVSPVATRTTYCTEEELKDYLGSPVAGTGYDALLRLSVNSASRAIDAYCNRRFWIDASTVVRTFTVGASDITHVDDIGSTTGLVIKTDSSGDGTFETTWAATDYELLPVDAAYALPEAKPWTAIHAVGDYTFPYLTAASRYTRNHRLQVTALWGWPTIPDMVRQACLIKAARLFHRRNSPQGIAAFDEFGPVRISRGQDGDAVELLADYRRADVFVG